MLAELQDLEQQATVVVNLVLIGNSWSLWMLQTPTPSTKRWGNWLTVSYQRSNKSFISSMSSQGHAVVTFCLPRQPRVNCLSNWLSWGIICLDHCPLGISLKSYLPSKRSTCPRRLVGPCLEPCRWSKTSTTYFFLAESRFSRISGSKPFLTDALTKWSPEGVLINSSGFTLQWHRNA